MMHNEKHIDRVKEFLEQKKHWRPIKESKCFGPQRFAAFLYETVAVSVAQRGYIPKAENTSTTLDVEILRTVAEGADHAVVLMKIRARPGFRGDRREDQQMLSFFLYRYFLGLRLKGVQNEDIQRRFVALNVAQRRLAYSDWFPVEKNSEEASSRRSSSSSSEKSAS